MIKSKRAVVIDESNDEKYIFMRDLKQKEKMANSIKNMARWDRSFRCQQRIVLGNIEHCAHIGGNA